MKSPSLYWCSIYRPANLFPKSYLEEQRITNSQRVSNIANRAYVEWGENIDNSDQSPSEYFPKYAARFDEGELEQIMYWHALPEGWHQMDYDRFLEEQRQRVAQVTQDGYQKLTNQKSVRRTA